MTQTSSSGPEAAPLISVVMPVFNEERFIGGTLRELLSQDYPRECLELLVCDGGSTDRTRDIVEELAATDPRIRLLDNPGRRSSSGRNVGFRHARGEFVVVIDGHVRIGHQRLLRNIADCFRESGADCLGRPQPLIPSAPGSISEAIAYARASRLGHSPSSLIHSDYEGPAPAASMGAAYRKRVFEAIGFVDESFDACEDLDFNTRLDEAGLSCFTSPRLTVRYFARDSLRGLFRQMYRYGFGRYRYLRKHPNTLGPAQLAPAALLFAILALPVLLLVSRGLALVDAALIAAYLTLVAGFSALLAGQTRWRHLLRYLAIFPVIHLGIGWGFLSALLRRGEVGGRNGEGQPRGSLTDS